MATLAEITDRIRAAVGDDAGAGKALKLDFLDEGCIHIDGGCVTNEDQPADCTLSMSKDVFEELARGRLDPAMALMRGKLKVSGDLSVAMQLGRLLAGRDG